MIHIYVYHLAAQVRIVKLHPELGPVQGAARLDDVAHHVDLLLARNVHRDEAAGQGAVGAGLGFCARPGPWSVGVLRTSFLRTAGSGRSRSG